jgi:hypothetical protein
MKLVSDLTVEELENAIWICSLGGAAVGGWPKEAYQKELKRKSGC